MRGYSEVCLESNDDSRRYNLGCVSRYWEELEMRTLGSIEGYGQYSRTEV